MKKLFWLLFLYAILAWSLALADFGTSIDGKEASVTCTHTAACDSAWVVFGYDGDAAAVDTANMYDSLKVLPCFSGNGKTLCGDGLDLDSIGVHVVKIYYFSGDAIIDIQVGVWEHRATTGDTLNALAVGKDSTTKAIHDANKLNFYNWSDAQRDSILNTVEDANKVNYMRWTAAEVGSLLNTVKDANKVNFMRWTAAQVGSLLNTVEDANKANYMANVVAMTTLLDDSLGALKNAGLVLLDDSLGNSKHLVPGISTVVLALLDDSLGLFKNTGLVLLDDSLGNSKHLVPGISTVTLALLDDSLGDAKHDILLYMPTAAACGSGVGIRTLTITVKDTSDSVAIAGFEVDIYDSSSSEPQANGETNSNGVFTCSLDDETYTVHIRKTPYNLATPRYFTITGDMDSTFYASAFDAGDPASASMCRIYINDIRDLGAVELEDYELRAYIPEKYIPVRVGEAIRAPRITAATSNSSGYVYLDVYRSTGLTAGDGTSTVLYDLELLDADGEQIVRRRNVEIPDQASWEIDWTE